MENTHFKATSTDQISKLKQLIRPTKELVSEGIVRIDEDGIEVEAADPAMVGLVNFKIQAEFFDTYNVNEEVTAGINFERLYAFLKKATNNDKLTLRYGEAEVKDMWLMENEVEEGFTIRKGFKDLNLSEDDIPSVGQLEYENSFEVETGKIKAVLSRMSSFSDSIEWKAKKDGLKLTATVDDERQLLEAFLDTENQHIRYEEFEKETASLYSISMLETQLAGKTLPSLADRVDVELSTDYPIRVTHEDENFMYRFVIAPRIEDDR